MEDEADGGSGGVEVVSMAAVEVHVGIDRSCALGDDMQVYCWGSNNPYDAEPMGATAVARPEPVAGLAVDVIDLGVGMVHACALNTSGEVMCWGNNARGQLGTGTPASSVDPVPVGGLPTGIVEIAAAMKNTCALDADGDVYCWGDNHFDQLGNDTVGDETPIDTLDDRSSLVPVKVTAVAGPLTSLSVGYECACGTNEAGELVCWGATTCSLRGASEYVDGGQGLQVQSTGDNPHYLGEYTAWGGSAHLCSVDDEGRAWCRGGNDFGQLGDGTTVFRETPVRVQDLVPVTQISALWGHTCAVGLDGSVFCWGRNVHGELGVGDDSDSRTPLRVTLPG